MRIGFMSAPQIIVDAVVMHVRSRLSSVHPRTSDCSRPPTLLPCPRSHALTQFRSHFQTMNSNLQPPTFTQVLSLRMLQFWGYDKLKAHIDRVAEFYRQKRDVFEGLMQKYLAGLAEWNTPEAGMFFWSVHLPLAAAAAAADASTLSLTTVAGSSSSSNFRARAVRTRETRRL